MALKVFSNLTDFVRAEQSHLLNTRLSHKDNPRKILSFYGFCECLKSPESFPNLPLSVGPGCRNPAQLERAFPKNTQAASCFYRQPKSTSPLQSCNKSKWILCSKVKGMSQSTRKQPGTGASIRFNTCPVLPSRGEYSQNIKLSFSKKRWISGLSLQINIILPTALCP